MFGIFIIVLFLYHDCLYLRAPSISDLHNESAYTKCSALVYFVHETYGRWRNKLRISAIFVLSKCKYGHGELHACFHDSFHHRRGSLEVYLWVAALKKHQAKPVPLSEIVYLHGNRSIRPGMAALPLQRKPV